jgi:hypothetical protein
MAGHLKETLEAQNMKEEVEDGEVGVIEETIEDEEDLEDFPGDIADEEVDESDDQAI